MAKFITILALMLLAASARANDIDCAQMISQQTNVVLFNTQPLFSPQEELEIIAEMDKVHVASGALNPPGSTMNDISFRWTEENGIRRLTIPGLSQKFVEKIENFMREFVPAVTSEFNKEGVQLTLAQVHIRSDSVGTWLHTHNIRSSTYVFFTKSESTAGTVFEDDEGVWGETTRGQTLLMTDYVRIQRLGAANPKIKTLPHGPAAGRRIVIIGGFNWVGP